MLNLPNDLGEGNMASETGFKTFRVTYANEPWRNRSFKVRGICRCDVLNPCWDDRPDDVPGLHWASEPGDPFPACQPCTEAAFAKAEAR